MLQGGGGSLLGVLILTPIAAAGGAAAGAAAAKPEAEVDQIRSDLSVAIQQTDFNTMLREELRRTSAAQGRIQIIDVATPVVAPTVVASAAAPATGMAIPQVGSHPLNVDYNLGMVVTGAVVPDVQASVLVKGQILAPDRKTVLHTSTWLYCGPARTFDHAAANNGAALRADYRRAAQVMAEAIVFDTFVSAEPRHLLPPRGCMNFDNLPSGIARSGPEIPVMVAPRPVSDPPASTPR